MQSLRRAMISSTTLDLPEHRQRVKTACEAADVLPKMMENLTARDEDAVSTSLSMVDAADIYIGIYGRRYGHVPKGATTSITEMELDRAIERKITILAFLMDPAHLVTADMVETSAAAQRKLERLKQRASAGRIRKLFSTAEELGGQVESALRDILLRELARQLQECEARLAQARAAQRQAQDASRRSARALKEALAKLAARELAAQQAGARAATGD